MSATATGVGTGTGTDTAPTAPATGRGRGGMKLCRNTGKGRQGSPNILLALIADGSVHHPSSE